MTIDGLKTLVFVGIVIELDPIFSHTYCSSLPYMFVDLVPKLNFQTATNFRRGICITQYIYITYDIKTT